MVEEGTSFADLYRLTTGTAIRLEVALDGNEEPVLLSAAMIDRLRDFGREIGQPFLAAALLDESMLRLYFLAPDGIAVRDFPLEDDDYEGELFRYYCAYLFKRLRLCQGKPHRPN